MACVGGGVSCSRDWARSPAGGRRNLAHDGDAPWSILGSLSPVQSSAAVCQIHGRELYRALGAGDRRRRRIPPRRCSSGGEGFWSRSHTPAASTITKCVFKAVGELGHLASGLVDEGRGAVRRGNPLIESLRVALRLDDDYLGIPAS